MTINFPLAPWGGNSKKKKTNKTVSQGKKGKETKYIKFLSK